MASSLDELVLRERRGAVLVLTLNRPQRLNAWTDELEDRYFDLLAEADDDPAVRAIVVTGAGRGFCAGADMAQLDDISADGDGSRVLDRPRPRHFPLSVRKPLLAAINGAAAGLGLVEALYCDLRFCAADAKLTTAFVRRGLIAEYGLAWILPRLVGSSRALDLLLSGRVVRGKEAVSIGLVDSVVGPDENVLDAAVSYAHDLAALCSPRAMAAIKGQVRGALERSFVDAVAEDDRLMLASFRWPDLAEGVSSYSARRAPAFPPLPSGTV